MHHIQAIVYKWQPRPQYVLSSEENIPKMSWKTSRFYFFPIVLLHTLLGIVNKCVHFRDFFSLTDVQIFFQGNMIITSFSLAVAIGKCI